MAATNSTKGTAGQPKKRRRVIVTDIEQKALELDLIAQVIAAYHTTRMIEDAHKHCHASPHVREAIDRLIASVAEADKARHAAEMREQAERFSEAARLAVDYVTNKSSPLGRFGYGSAEYNAVRNSLSPFILAPFDPLVEAMADLEWRNAEQLAPDLRAALESRGLAIVKKEAVNG